MKFLSGVRSIPPLQVSVNFNMSGRWMCKATVSTCALSITLPVHYYRSMDSMKETLFDAIKMTQGFDL